MVEGANSENLQVSIIIDGMETVIKPDQINKISLPAYLDTQAAKNKNIYTTVATIQIANTSTFTSYLYSVFPGSRDKLINDLKSSRWGTDGYCFGTTKTENAKGVWLSYPTAGSTGGKNIEWTLQRANQWLTFRIKDAYDGTEYYDTGNQFEHSNKLSYDLEGEVSGEMVNYQVLESDPDRSNPAMAIYPYLSEKGALQLDSDSTHSKLVLAPTEAVVVPLMVQYFTYKDEDSISKIISFDLRPSLYSDPINYLIEFDVTSTDTVQQKSARSSLNRLMSKTMLESVQASTASTLQEQRAIINASRYKTIIKNQ
jgi:hypothetical protein